jgi:DNA-binding HxlR family transcriptional regulator
MNIKFPEMDDHCKKIFVALILGNDKLRFTELHQVLVAMGYKISRPTLSQHLKHLTRDGLVTRKVEDVKNVSYSVVKDFMMLKPLVEKATKRFNEDREDYYSMSPEDQTLEVNRQIIFKNLFQLEARIAFSSEGKPQDSFTIMYLEMPYFRRYEDWLVNKCLEDEGYRKRVLQKINELINTISG